MLSASASTSGGEEVAFTPVTYARLVSDSISKVRAEDGIRRSDPKAPSRIALQPTQGLLNNYDRRPCVRTSRTYVIQNTKPFCVATAAVSLKTANLKLRDQPKHAPTRARLGVLSQRALGGASAGVRWVRAPSIPWFARCAGSKTESRRTSMRRTIRTRWVPLAVSALVLSLTSISSAKADVFIKTGSMAVPRSNPAATLLPDGKVLVAGGYDGTNVTSSAELYDPATGKWIATTSMSTNRTGHKATLLPNGKVLVAGGGLHQHVGESFQRRDL